MLTDSILQSLNSKSVGANDLNESKNCLTILLMPNYARRFSVQIGDLKDDSPENIFKFCKEDFVETYSDGSLFGRENKLFMKKEQFEIVDLFRSWIKSHDKQEENEIQFLASPYIKEMEGGDTLLTSLESQLGLSPICFNLAEQARLSFLGLKHGILGYRVNSRLLHINIDQNKIHLVFGDTHKQDKIIEIDFGINQIAEAIVNLRKSGQMDTLTFLIKSNLYKFIEQSRLFGKPQLIGFDEMTARLLSQILSRDSKVQRVNATSIQNLCYKMIDSKLSYWNGLTTINSESTDYAAARIILAGFILEGLNGITCTFETDSFVKGFFIDKLLINDGLFQYQFSGHNLDWQRSANDILLRFSPSDFSRSCQLAFLAGKIFDSSHGWLHSWSRKQRIILWLSSFFHHTLSKYNAEFAIQIISELQGINQIESQLITSIIGLSSSGLIKQSRHLDVLPIELQPIARKMAAIVQIAKASDISGRSAIQNIKLEGKANESNSLILKVFPRLDPAPEIIQINSLKKSFESQFDQKVEVKIVEAEIAGDEVQKQYSQTINKTSNEISIESIKSLI